MSRQLYRTSSLSLYKLILVSLTAAPTLFRQIIAAPLLSALNIEHNDVFTTTTPHTKPGSDEFWLRMAFSAFLVLIGGVFSGLTLGLMGLDMVNLQVLSSSGSEEERRDANKVMVLLEKGRHWVLVVLLLSNVVVNESLPIFLDSVLGGGVGAVVLSTALIVIFGEIIPQAVCARYGLQIGAKCTPFVLILMYLEFPVAWPIAKLLDTLLGQDHGTVYKKAELKTLVALHGHIGDEMLNEDEVTIISAVLELSDKPVSSIMTPLEDTYTLSSDISLDQEVVDEILALGHSRIPIHTPEDEKDFIGMLIVKRLISYDPSQAEKISSFPLTVLPETGPDSTCLDALNYFQQGRSHILLVSETPGVKGGALGVVSLEDIIEEMIGEEIIDESDVYIDLHTKVKVVRGPAKRVAAGKALAPLVQGVIERRKTYRQNTVNDSEAPRERTSNPPPINPAAKAFDKVRVRGGGLPERRSGFVNRVTSSPSGEGANPFESGSPKSTRTTGETEPLIKKKDYGTGGNN